MVVVLVRHQWSPAAAERREGAQPERGAQHRGGRLRPPERRTQCRRGRRKRASRNPRLPGPTPALRESLGQRARHGRGRARGHRAFLLQCVARRPGRAPSRRQQPRPIASHGRLRPRRKSSQLWRGVARPVPRRRRAQIQEFADSDHLDACPKLRNRPRVGSLPSACPSPSWGARSA
jgi:hypothetical protein